MHYRNNHPKLITLSGAFDYEEEYLSAPFDFLWRPSKLKTVAPAIGAVLGIIAVVVPITAPILAPTAAILVTTGVVAAGVHEIYRDDTAPTPSQLEYREIEPPIVTEPVTEKKTPWGLIAAGVGAAYLMTR